MKKILLLGAGLVTRPLTQYLLNQPGIELLVASRTESKAKALIDNHPKGRTSALNVLTEKTKLEELIAGSDVVISLLPWIHHLQAAELCLKHSKHLVTTSYVSPAMKQLDSKVKEKGLLFLNEIGLDPGIDHMSAVKIIDNVRKKGGKIISFESVCGGLPAPEANDNPFGYKFSWSPRGVVLAGRNDARYLENGREFIIDGKDLFNHYWKKNVNTLGELEVYPNRDSLIYQSLYGLKYAKTIFRGTFRNIGWCKTMNTLAKLGYFDDTERPELDGMTFAEVTANLIGISSIKNVKPELAEYLKLDVDSDVIKRFQWLGLFSNEKANTNVPNYLDILAERMLEKMQYKKGERDMVVLQHDFIAEYDTAKREHIIALMIDYGIPEGDSAMARTVSLPAAIAVKLICEEKFNSIGVMIPNVPEIYEPVLKELESLNIMMKETTELIN